MTPSFRGLISLARVWRPAFVGACLLGLAAAARAEPPPTWPDLKDFTPEGLAHCFADFAYELSDQVQDAGTFLQRKRGDCADFAKLVSETLNQHGYTSKLVVVMMEEQTHVVCYVKESHGYLDYNLRAAAQPIVSSDGSLEDIADKVAAYFRSKWRMVSEIRYQGATPAYVFSAFPPARPTHSPPLQVADKAPAAPPERSPGIGAGHAPTAGTADAAAAPAH